ncbi:serine hydrolase domain-containing protein [Brevundimonas sp. NIBR11]|uniref:serine hydrolase domain-containing protein n=1 Tax=Brevundimonas sp. NIBR11 TaxID=3015999 RepID=UPI0022F0EE9C|nr:serine hydrolase domain-containing protein [Brevundimonas sp. NIBR11]WGM31393.1 D-aminopeptidase [Brevundimonas sp. NIBR11]
MFHVPRTAGNHPRLFLGCIAAVVLIGGAGLAAVLTSRPLPTASDRLAALPPRPAVEVVENLPQLTARLQREAEAGRFMGAVLVARGDEILFRQAYGTADVATGAPLTIHSRFRLASISKQFTAAAILKLQDEGKLTIGDPVCQWIQPCPAAWAPLKIHHLISHTSGIPDLMARPGWGARRTTPATLDELTEDSKAFRLSFEPGSKVQYNNAGFNLAAAIVEKVSGQRFPDYLRTTFFEPLGMADTGFDDDSDLGIVTGHANFPAGLTAQRNPNVSIVYGAGALYSTLDDLLVWERALHTGHLLTPYSYAQMIMDHSPADQPNERGGRPHRAWGYGLMANRLGARVTPAFQDWEIYHTGSWSGFRNIEVWQPDQRVAVIVLSNNYHQQREVLLISQQGMAEALGHEFPTALAD